MCGIWGIVKNANQKNLQTVDLKHVELMAMLTSLRGEHSTGAMWAYLDKESQFNYNWVKIEGNYYNLLDCKEFQERFYQTFYKQNSPEKLLGIIGHGRHATLGEINTKNAHPFSHKHIMLVHNGTVKDGIDQLKDKTDSESICVMLAKNPGKEVEILNDINGPYVLIWFDTEENTLNIARNLDRPLHYYQDTWTTHYMSERQSLEFVLRSSTTAKNAIKPVDPWNLYKIPLTQGDKIKVIPLEKKIKSYLYTGTTIYTPPPVNQNAWPKQNGAQVPKLIQSTQTKNDTKTGSSTPTTQPTKKELEVDPVKYYDYLKTFVGQYVVFELMELQNKKQNKLYCFGMVCDGEKAPAYTNTVFKTIREKERDYIEGDLYEGMVTSIEMYDGQWTLVFKTKTVKWVGQIDEAEDLTEEEQQEIQKELDDPNITLYNGVKLSRDVFETKANKGCTTCTGALPKHAPERVTAIFKQNNDFDLYCEYCKDEFTIH